MPEPMDTNVLYYGDNLDILRRYLPDAAVDLVYLDPPFNSNRDYNVIFRDESGQCHRCPAAGLRGHLALTERLSAKWRAWHERQGPMRDRLASQ
jgi:hypothetical protein